MTEVPARDPRSPARCNVFRGAAFLALFALVCSAKAGSAPVFSHVPVTAAAPPHSPSPSRTAAPAAEVTTLEDTLARAFERRRAEAHLRKLTRINDRPLLRQLVCTAAITGSPPMTPLALESQADNALFPTYAPDSLPPELRRVADYDDRSTAAGRKVKHYSIAVFRSPSQAGQFWVGVGLYWGYWVEWLALRSGTYTHAVAARAVIPACAAVH